MTPFIEYATIANHVYSIEKSGFYGIEIGILSSITIEKTAALEPGVNWYRIIDVDPSMRDSNSFYAQLYVKIENGKAIDAVIAIRGTITSSASNDWTDIKSFTSDVLGNGRSDLIPFYLPLAIQFYNRSSRYLSKFFPHLAHHIKLTGHSLGGAVAQLMPLQAGYGVPAVVFNSPGCGDMPSVMKNQAGWVYSVNSRYGFINKIGTTLGHLYIVDVPNMAAEAKDFLTHFDEQDYQLSMQDYQQADRANSRFVRIGDDIKGADNRLDADVITYERVDNTRIQGQAMGMKTFGKALYAQHSMDNMLAALYLSQNAKIAHVQV